MVRSARITVRLPKEVADRITALHDWIFEQPELALARKSSTTANAFVMMKGLEALEATAAHEKQLAQQMQGRSGVSVAKTPKPAKSYDPEAGPTVMLGAVYNEWAKVADDD